MKKLQKGFSVLELMLAAAIFIIFSGGVVAVVLQGFDANRLGSEETIATQYASEGIEAARSIKNQSWATLAAKAGAGNQGIAASGGVWAFSGMSNVLNKYTRVITVADVQRDGSGNIVASGGTNDKNTKKVTSTVSWNVSPARANSIPLSTYLSNWRRNGFLVYGDGGTTTDAIKYRILDGKTLTWSTAAATADIDAGTANRALRAARVYASTTRAEKILISRHYNGTTQYIYAQVYNEITGSWGNVQLLSSWNAGTFLDVRNFDGTYLNNGNFMVVYSDNSSTPKMRTWDGSSWSSESSLTSLGGGTAIPTFVRIAARPGTNEVMGAFLDQAKHTNTEYWSGSAWSAITTHSTNDFNTPYQDMDFAWSPHTTTTGAITYITGGGDKSARIKIFQADGSGSGTWGAQANATNEANTITMMSISARSTADEFQVCTKDNHAPDNITCHKATFSGTTATWSDPTNNIITLGTVSSVNQITYDFDYEAIAGDPAVIVSSDNPSTPKLKKYTASTSTWDSSATSISISPFSLGVIQTVRLIPENSSDDIMVLLADANLDLYSVLWDGANNTVYTTPAGRAFSQHGTSGSATTDYWYDFVWDKP